MLLLASCTFTRAAEQEPAAPQVTPVPLVFANHTIFVFRAPMSGYPAQDRADAALKRIERALAKGGAHQPATRSINEGTQVLLDGALLFLVTPADINALAGDSTDVAAAESAAALGRALQAKRDQTDPHYLAVAIALCVAATAAWVIVLRLLAGLRRWAAHRFETAFSHHVERIRFRNVRLLDAEHYIRFMRSVSTFAIWTLGILLTYLWLTFVFGRIPYSRGWGEQLQNLFLDTAAKIADSVVGAIPGLLVVAFIVVLTRLATVTLASVFKRVESGELSLGWLDRDTAVPTRRLVSVVVWLFALAMAYPYLPGSHTAAFQGVTVLAGLMVSIGASSIVGQGASGLILMYTRSLRKGEYVKIGDVEGTVVALGMFETRLRTGLGAEVSTPNAWVLANRIENFSRAHPGSGYMIDTVVTIGYDTPWRQAQALLEQAALATEGISPTPPPYVMQTALSDFYIEYKLVVYATVETPRSRVEALNQLHQNIVDVFNAHGVQLLSPHFMQEPAQSHVVPREKWFTAPAKQPQDGA